MKSQNLNPNTKSLTIHCLFPKPLMLMLVVARFNKYSLKNHANSLIITGIITNQLRNFKNFELSIKTFQKEQTFVIPLHVHSLIHLIHKYLLVYTYYVPEECQEYTIGKASSLQQMVLGKAEYHMKKNEI